MKHSKRKLVLHEVSPVARLERLGERVALEHSDIHEKDLEISRGTADLRSADKALQTVVSVAHIYVKHFFADLPAIDPVKELFEVAVSRGVKFFFAVRSVMKGDGRMRERLSLHQVGDITGFRLGLLEEFRAHRNVVKEIPHDYAGAVGSADLFQIQLNGLIPGKAAQRLIRGSDACQGISGLCDHLYLRNGCNA